MTSVFFQVRGEPKTQGSTRAFVRGGRPIITSDTAGLKPWRDAIAWEAQRAMHGVDPFAGGVLVKVRFTLRRPKGQWRASGEEPLPSAPLWPDRKPDIDKLARAALDALTGVCYLDDSQVVELVARKHYQTRPTSPLGVEVTVTQLEEEDR